MRDIDTNPTGERREEDKPPAAEQSEQQKQANRVPGLKDREAETSDSYGNTRDSGETKR